MKMRRLIKDRKEWKKKKFFFCACELVNRHTVKKLRKEKKIKEDRKLYCAKKRVNKKRKKDESLRR